MTPRIQTIVKTVLLSLFVSVLGAQNLSLEQSFKNPPPSAQARTIWFWINGNVSKEGITADLEAMEKIGIQEALIFNVSLNHPQGTATYLGSEWLDHFKYAALEAKRLGLELGFHNGAGWSSSGGPSMTPEYAMQEVVYTETTHKGGNVFEGSLPKPESRLGYYKDIAILAFPKPKSEDRIDELEIKSLSGKVRSHLTPESKPVATSAVVKKSTIVNLTSKLTDDGCLEWNAPVGEWVILRIGHTPTGEMNRFPSDGGQGLECDKMNRQAVDLFWREGIEPIIDSLGKLVGTVVKRCHIDSYEVGTANWTPNFADEFQKLRSYDCHSYLPTLAGYYVESGEETERFLWDFRRTIGDLIATHYYGRFGELSRKHGMNFSMEPYWGPFDNMQIGENADLVMSEFWSGYLAFFDSPKFVASIAKLNGSPIAEAEAFTDEGGWHRHPGSLKAMGDLAWAQGINRFVFHCFVHQPWDIPPGLTLDRFGIDFNRLNTWWDQAKPFVDYIGRGQFLLQQGTSVADVLVFTGESSPNDALLMPEIKALGYDYDVIGSNKLSILSASGGQIHTANGATYQALVLPTTDWMTPETLMKFEALAKSGATILGTKPQKSPSLAHYPACDETVALLANDLWDTKLIKDGSIVDFLKNETLAPDFSIEQGSHDSIDFIHRKSEDTDIYFVVNTRKESRELACRFRITGKQPELWNAETGEITKASVWRENGDGTTTVSVPFESEASVFVVFRKPSISTDHITNAKMELRKPDANTLPNLEIIKAEYGMFLPDGLVDVTEVVKNTVQNNELNVHATRELCVGDPAPGYKKELRVRYKIGTVILEKNAMEREWLDVHAPDSGTLEILKAVFGKFERGITGIPRNTPTWDVTEKVKSMVASGISELQVSKEFCPKNQGNQSYALRLVYTTNGEEKTRWAPDGGTLKLTQSAPEPMLSHKDDKLNWVTPYPGELTYTNVSGKTKTVQVETVPEPLALTGEWAVSFPAKDGVSIDSKFNQLTSWTNSSEEAIRYFSGTASYHKQFNIPKHILHSGHSFQLDLGSVKEIAEVILNGKRLGILWKAPFRINIDSAVTEGVNHLEIKITNLWPNRLIGDEHLPLDYEREDARIKEWPKWLLNHKNRPTERTTFPAYQHWSKDSDLLPSGLLGPVKIVISKVETL